MNKQDVKDVLLMAAASAFWCAAIIVANVAYGDELCGPAGCREVVGEGCYFEIGTLSCSDKPIECYGLTREKAIELYGAAVGDLCDFVNYLEEQEEKLFVCKANAHRLRRQMRRQRRK